MSQYQEPREPRNRSAIATKTAGTGERRKKFWVPRRRVRARIRMADGNTVQGELYASVDGAGGAPGRLVDRLNNLSERFVPVAVDGKHILLNKSTIVMMEIDSGRYEIEDLDKAEAREIHVRVWFSDRMSINGTFFTCLPEAHRRALDYLNLSRCPFLALYCGGRAVLVNVDRIQHVSEVIHPG